MKYSYYYIETEIGSEIFKSVFLSNLEAEKDKRCRLNI